MNNPIEGAQGPVRNNQDHNSVCSRTGTDEAHVSGHSRHQLEIDNANA
jgi:hypothetical protein